MAKFNFATANDDAIRAFCERNGITVTITTACVWFKDIEDAKRYNATRCYRINTKPNKKRGNWYIARKG